MSEHNENTGRANRILAAAADLIMHYGYDKTTVSDIAREAGVSKGAIYLHWSSKDDLFEALLWREIWRYSADWLQRMEAETEATFVIMYKHSLMAMQDNGFILAVFRRDKRILGSYLQQKGAELFNRRFTMHQEFFQQMQAAGAIRTDITPDVLAYLMNAIGYGLVMVDDIITSDHIPPFEQVVTGMALMLDTALTPADGGNPKAGKQIIQGIVEVAKQQFADFTQVDISEGEQE